MSYKNRVRKNASEGSNPSISDIDEIILETMDCVNEGFLIQFAFELATRDCIDKGYDADKLLENNESSAYHTHRHNHYIELFSLRGLDAIGVIEP